MQLIPEKNWFDKLTDGIQKAKEVVKAGAGILIDTELRMLEEEKRREEEEKAILSRIREDHLEDMKDA